MMIQINVKFTSSTFRGAMNLILKTSSEHVTLLPFTPCREFYLGNSLRELWSHGGPAKIEIPNRLYISTVYSVSYSL